MLQPTIIGGKSNKTIIILNYIVEYVDFKRNYVYCNIYFGNIYARDRYSIPGARS